MSGSSLRLFGIGRFGIVIYEWVTSPAFMALSPTAKLVYFILATYASNNGRAFPSREQLAADTGFYPTTVSRAISELDEANFIRRYQRPDVPGRHNVYFLIPPTHPPSDAELAADLRRKEDGEKPVKKAKSKVLGRAPLKVLR